MAYVKAIHVQYGDSSGSIGGEDINKGFGGQYVYLVPEYTWKRSEAAHAFSVLTTYNEDLNAADMAKGDGKSLYRYLCAFYNGANDTRITKVWLSRTKDTKEGDGRTADINKDRGGDFLYLCWENGTDETDTSLARDTRAATDGDDEQCVMNVPIESLLFSQSSISANFSATREARDGGEFREGEDIKAIIDTLRAMSDADRKAIVELFPLMNVVPIPYAGEQHLMSCDNRRLHIFRSVLPPGTHINVITAPPEEIKKLKWKWTSIDGLNIKVRSGKKKGDHDEN